MRETYPNEDDQSKAKEQISKRYSYVRALEAAVAFSIWKRTHLDEHLGFVEEGTYEEKGCRKLKGS
jgi:hypothetical protein